MSAKVKRKYYVVWVGKEPGVYDTWDGCRRQVEGVPGAKFKSFPTLDEATTAYSAREPRVVAGVTVKTKPRANALPSWNGVIPEGVNPHALAVDAACSGNPGRMEYRGVYVGNGQQLFRVGPLEEATNNIGEYLAIVHGLAYIEQQARKGGMDAKSWQTMMIYSDSRTALSWIRQRTCKSKLQQTARNAKVFEMIGRAQTWLDAHPDIQIKIEKWQTEKWGEIPADFGRK